MEKFFSDNNFTNRLLIFIHIPKTGGMTFDGILQKNFKRKEILSCYARRGLSLEKINALSPQKLNKYSCIRGNFPFGVHTLFQKQASYITFVRNPLAQIISNYHFVVKSDSKEERKIKANMSLREFVLSIDDNYQTRHIAGKLETQECQTSQRLLEQALINIEKHFAFVGITERFDESLILIQKIIGLKRIDYCRRNINKKINRNKNIERKTIDLIKSRFELDFQLYKRAEEILDYKIKTEEKNFISKLNSLRKSNSDHFFYKRFFDFFNYNYNRLFEYFRYQFFSSY
jgi:hypothetical protein